MSAWSLPCTAWGGSGGGGSYVNNMKYQTGLTCGISCCSLHQVPPRSRRPGWWSCAPAGSHSQAAPWNGPNPRQWTGPGPRLQTGPYLNLRGRYEPGSHRFHLGESREFNKLNESSLLTLKMIFINYLSLISDTDCWTAVYIKSCLNKTLDSCKLILFAYFGAALLKMKIHLAASVILCSFSIFFLGLFYGRFLILIWQAALQMKAIIIITAATSYDALPNIQSINQPTVQPQSLQLKGGTSSIC